MKYKKALHEIVSTYELLTELYEVCPDDTTPRFNEKEVLEMIIEHYRDILKKLNHKSDNNV